MTYTYPGYPEYDEIRSQICGAVAVAIPSLATYSYMPDLVNVDSFVCGEQAIQTNQTMRGHEQIDLSCYVFARRTAIQQGAQTALGRYLHRGGAYSVRAAIMGLRRTPTQKCLNGRLGDRGDLTVEPVDGYREYQIGPDGKRFYGARILIKIVE